jgi:pimeloyl-ACP methyl ester carboxylesterase
MYFNAAGDGPPIILVHAFPLDGRMWRDQIRDLAGEYRVLAPDMPGFGKSPRPEGNPLLDDWARALLTLCKSNGIESAVIAGCSMGGYLAFALNRIDPTFAAGFCLVNTRAAADTQDARRTRYEMVERARHEGTAFLQETEPPVSRATSSKKPEVVEFIRLMMADATPVGVMAAQRVMASRKDSRGQLESIRVPVTVVYGIDDPIIPRVEVESMVSAIANAQYVPIEDAGHLSPLEKPAEVTSAIRGVATRAYQTARPPL